MTITDPSDARYPYDPRLDDMMGLDWPAGWSPLDVLSDPEKVAAWHRAVGVIPPSHKHEHVWRPSASMRWARAGTMEYCTKCERMRRVKGRHTE